MDTIYNLQRRAASLRSKTQTDSITPEDVGGLQYDTLAYLADMEQNLDGLGIRKVYLSVTDMQADGAPVGTNGKALRLGQLVTIYNASAPTADGTGNVYAYQKPGWMLVGYIGLLSGVSSDIKYLLQNTYYLQEGIGCAAFNYAMSLGNVPIQSEEVTRQEGDSIILDTSANRFVLERSGKFYNKFLSNGASLQGWDVYANIRHTFLNRQDNSYWYRKSDGTLTKGSSTFVIRNWLDELQGFCDFQETEITQHGSRITGLETKIQELGAFDTFAALFARAAKFDIVSNNAIAFLHGTYKQAEGIYHGVLILQQVEKNNAGGGTAMQYIYIEKRQFTRYINFSATAVTEVQTVQNHGARNLSLSGRVLQLKNMWGFNVGGSATLPDNGNLYEGTAGASSVPITLAKTFGGTATATIGAATSARAGVMTVDHVNKISKLEERVLQYLYPKIYQLNEGAGARKFDGFYTGTASVSDERKTAATEGYSYKVVFYLDNFHLQELSPGGVTTNLYSEWDRIGDIASSESYARRDILFYIYVPGEGSTYYAINSEGNIEEKSATYLLRRLIDGLKTDVLNNSERLDGQERDIVSISGHSADNSARLDALQSLIKELGAFSSLTDLLAAAATFDVASDAGIAMMHGTILVAEGRYSSVIITQQVTTNADGSGKTMQYYSAGNVRYSRYINFTSTGIAASDGVQPAQYDIPRNLVHSGTLLKMTDMYGNNVGSSVNI